MTTAVSTVTSVSLWRRSLGLYLSLHLLLPMRLGSESDSLSEDGKSPSLLEPAGVPDDECESWSELFEVALSD
jgi:hypothetical protein